MSISVEVQVYYKNSNGNELCFTHAARAAVLGDQVTTEINTDAKEDSDGFDPYFGMSFHECSECHK